MDIKELLEDIKIESEELYKVDFDVNGTVRPIYFKPITAGQYFSIKQESYIKSTTISANQDNVTVEIYNESKHKALILFYKALDEKGERIFKSNKNETLQKFMNMPIDKLEMVTAPMLIRPDDLKISNLKKK